MGREHDAGPVPRGLGESLAGRCDACGTGADEPLVRVPVADVGNIDVRHPLAADFAAGGDDIAAVLLATRVGPVRRKNASDGTAHTRARHVS